MTTKKTKSQAMQQLEKISGGPLTLGRYVKAIRLGEEMTQKAFAAQLGISAQHLSDVENARELVEVERAARFAKILGYPVEQFVRLALDARLKKAKLKFTVELRHAS